MRVSRCRTRRGSLSADSLSKSERELVSMSLGRIWVSTSLGRMKVSIGLQEGRGSHRQPGAPGCEQTRTQT